MRLFIAVDLSDEARQAVGAEQKRIAAALNRAGSSLRVIPPERMHLTLVFLGEVEEARVPALCEASARDVDAAPFDIGFRELGAFPPRGAPRVLWIGVNRGSNELIGLQRTMSARVAALHVPLEDRSFSPHLTLGRWRESRSSVRAALESVATGGEI